MKFRTPNGLFSAVCVAAALLLGSFMVSPSYAEAGELKTYSKKGVFRDVRFELANVIVSRGLKVDLNGNVGNMLKRTGGDVGSSKPIYKKAQYFIFCSAKLTRAMLEADAAALGHCPYVIYIYETVANPGVIVVGYNKLPTTGSAAARKAFAAIDAFLDSIVKDALK